MPVNTTAIANLLRPGLAAVFGDYPSYPSQWSEIFEVYDSDKAYEQEIEMKFTGLAQIRPEGSPTAVDTMGQRSITNYNHKYVALQFNITRMALINNLYKTKFPQIIKSLKKSMATTKEILGSSVLNNGFSTDFPIGDGVPLFSPNHPTDVGVVANMPTVASDLNEASLESAIINIQQFVDAAGLICMTKPAKLIVPAALQYVANRLLGSSFRTNTSTNDISAVYNLDSVPQGYRTNQFLTSSNAWFLLTDAPDGFKHYVRESIQTDVYTDFSTDNLMAKALECYSFGVSNFRAAWGNPGV
jgi:Mu-like prophage major head subunit gpT